jgi:LPS sulfotransferase NodH
MIESRTSLFDSARLQFENRRLRHRLRLLQHWWFRKHTPYQPFFVIATARSGSNLLIDYLNQIPGVQSYWEILCHTLPEGPRKRQLPPKRALRHVRYSLQTLNSPIRGCKFLLCQLANCKLTLGSLETAFPSAKFIVLYRESLAEQFVSFRSAVETKQWVLYGAQEAKQARPMIDSADFERYCVGIRQRYEHVLAHPSLCERGALLSYEELTADPTGCLRQRVCPLLGVPEIEPRTVLRKQNPQPLADRVANYSAVEALLTSPLARQKYALPRPQHSSRRAA